MIFKFPLSWVTLSVYYVLNAPRNELLHVHYHLISGEVFFGHRHFTDEEI